MKINRRNFLQLIGVGASAVALPSIAVTKVIEEPVQNDNNFNIQNQQLEILNTLASKGVPVPLSSYMKAMNIYWS